MKSLIDWSFDVVLNPNTYGREGSVSRVFVVSSTFVFVLLLAIDSAEGNFIWIVFISLRVSTVFALVFVSKSQEALQGRVYQL